MTTGRASEQKLPACVGEGRSRPAGADHRASALERASTLCTWPVAVANDRLFLGLKRPAGHDELLPLTKSGVQQMMRLAEREAGIKRRVHPHLFRNSAATWMRTKGLDPLTIARVMAWTSPRMLQRIYHSFQYDEGYFHSTAEKDG